MGLADTKTYINLKIITCIFENGIALVLSELNITSHWDEIMKFLIVCQYYIV